MKTQSVELAILVDGIPRWVLVPRKNTKTLFDIRVLETAEECGVTLTAPDVLQAAIANVPFRAR